MVEHKEHIQDWRDASCHSKTEQETRKEWCFI